MTTDTKWVWDVDGNPICAEKIPEGDYCAGEVTFFSDWNNEKMFGMCMTCCEPWDEGELG